MSFTLAPFSSLICPLLEIDFCSHAMPPTLETMSKRPGARKEAPADRIEAALNRGLASDSSAINEKPVYRQLAERSEAPYSFMMEFWAAQVTNLSNFSPTPLTLISYSKRIPDANPQSLRSLKHFAEAVALGTEGRLDKEGGRPTVHTVRNKLRHFMAAWERQHDAIPKHVHDSVCAVSAGATHSTQIFAHS